MGFNVKEKLQSKATEMGMSQMTPSETTIGRRLANILTSTEFELFRAVDRLVEAADDVDGEPLADGSMRARRDEILEVADAVAEQCFEAWWWEHYGAEFVDNPEDARDLCGMDVDEWQQQIQTWAELYRERAPDRVDGMTDAEIAQLHVERQFGIDLEEFAAEVVEWTAHEHVDAICRQNLRAATDRIHHVAAVLEDDVGDGVEVTLEQDVVDEE